MATHDDNEQPSQVFARNLRARRQLLDISQAELAETVGVAQQTIAKIEALKRPISIDEAHALALALNTTYFQLMRASANLPIAQLRTSLRSSRRAVAELERELADAESHYKTAAAAAEEAATRLAEVKTLLAVRRDEVENLDRLVSDMERGRSGKH